MSFHARALLVVVLAGCAPAPEVGSLAEPIVNGTPGGDDAVVVLQNFESGGLCTGTIIAPRVVLTAKHCIQEAFAAGPANPRNIMVGVGDNVRDVSEVLRVLEITTTPGVYTEDSRGSVNGTLVGSDVAILLLEAGAPGVNPIPIRRMSHSDLGGQTITAIGFGQTPSGQVGQKYTVTGRVQGTDTELIYVGAITCQGDSGGPAVTMENEVAGVVSFGAGSCGSGYGAYNAIFPFLDMIDAVLTEAGTCLNDGAERCDGADNDCNDLVDETCTPIGGECGTDTQCVGLMCRSTVRGSICTTPCDPLHPDFGCSAGFYCARSTGCEGLCVPIGDDEGMLGIGEDCTDDVECASLHCADPGDGRQRCLTPCRGDDGMCLAGEACVANPGACGSCVDEAILVSMRGLGESCEADNECRSSACFEDVNRSYCSRACAADSECPTGYHCRDAFCVAGPRGDIGDPCLTNGDCGNRSFCAMRGLDAWCSAFCESEPCPGGFSCVEAGGRMLCAPDLGLVGDPCEGAADCVSGLCAAMGDASICTRQCGPDAHCASGFECRRTADGLSAVCAPPAEPPPVEGGCSASGARVPGAGFGVLFALIGLVFAIRRRIW